MKQGAARKSRPYANIILTGFMGTGKSAVGRVLARRLGWEFVDTDDLIERRTGRDVPAIFAEEGEAGFRTREREVVASLAGKKRLVISTGGGVLLDRENLDVLRSLGPLVLLRAAPETILARLGSRNERPLLADAREPEARLGRIRDLLAGRSAAYGACDVAVDTDSMKVVRVATEVLRAVEGLASRKADKKKGAGKT